MSRSLSLASLFLGLAALALPAAGLAQENADKAAEEPPIQISAVRVSPDKPAADTLCRLQVELQNGGGEIATQLGFTVTINGQKLPVYESHLFMFPVPSGGPTELPLYNFWSTESSRPMPKDGKLEIVVTLREARWMKIAMEEEVETWTPLGDVPGLPVSRSVTVEMDKSGG